MAALQIAQLALRLNRTAHASQVAASAALWVQAQLFQPDPALVGLAMMPDQLIAS